MNVSQALLALSLALLLAGVLCMVCPAWVSRQLRLGLIPQLLWNIGGILVITSIFCILSCAGYR